MGYTVVVKDHTAATTSDASGKALIVISSTVTSGNVGTKFKAVAVPVVVWENALCDSELGMTGTISWDDYGATEPLTTVTIATATVMQPTVTVIQPTTTPGPTTKTALFVVGSTQLVGGSPQLTISDSAVQARLQGLGYTVVVRDQSTSTTTDATGKTIILISATVNSGSVNSKFRDVRVPVITWEHALYDDIKMTGTESGVDYGGASTSQMTTQINLADPTQPITAGLTGTQTVFTTAQPLPFGLTAAAQPAPASAHTRA